MVLCKNYDHLNACSRKVLRDYYSENLHSPFGIFFYSLFWLEYPVQDRISHFGVVPNLFKSSRDIYVSEKQYSTEDILF